MLYDNFFFLHELQLQLAGQLLKVEVDWPKSVRINAQEFYLATKRKTTSPFFPKFNKEVEIKLI